MDFGIVRTVEIEADFEVVVTTRIPITDGLNGTAFGVGGVKMGPVALEVG